MENSIQPEEIETLVEQPQIARTNIQHITQQAETVQQLYDNAKEELEASRAQIRCLQHVHEDEIEDLTKTAKIMPKKLDEIVATNEEIIKSSLSTRVVSVLMVIVILSSGLFIASNLAAMKLLNLGPFPVDGGIFLFPLTYILDDVLKEIYGTAIAKKVILTNFILCILILVVLQIVEAIPDTMYFRQNLSFYLMMEGMGRIFFASITAALLSRLVDNRCFEYFFCKKPDAPAWTRALYSSLTSRAVDMVFFDLLAFYGKVSMPSLLRQLFLAYVLATILEASFLPVENLISDRIARTLCYRHGKNITKVTKE